MSKDDEMILVVKRSLFDQLGDFQGLRFEAEHYLPQLLSAENNCFLRRGDAEPDPEFKQLIPYAMVVHDGKVLYYVRGKKGGESRLHAKGSVGIGGHVNDQDANGGGMNEAAYHTAVQRELHEELQINTAYKENIVALLNDDSNPVGRVHLGVVHIFVLESADVAANEDEITELGFLTPAELRARKDSLESWSQICVKNLEQLLASCP